MSCNTLQHKHAAQTDTYICTSRIAQSTMKGLRFRSRCGRYGTRCGQRRHCVPCAGFFEVGASLHAAATCSSHFGAPFGSLQQFPNLLHFGVHLRVQNSTDLRLGANCFWDFGLARLIGLVLTGAAQVGTQWDCSCLVLGR